MSGRPTDELCAGYEALRATATGSALSETPRGLALLLAQGLPAWMRAWVLLPPAPSTVSDGERRLAAGGFGADVVRVLTEMALGCGSELAAS